MYCPNPCCGSKGHNQLGQIPIPAGGIIGTGLDIIGGIFGGERDWRDVDVSKWASLPCEEARQMAITLDAVATPADWQRLFQVANQMGARHFAAAAAAQNAAMAANIWYEQCKAMTTPFQRPANPIVLWYREMLGRTPHTHVPAPSGENGAYARPTVPAKPGIALPLIAGGALLLLTR